MGSSHHGAPDFGAIVNQKREVPPAVKMGALGLIALGVAGTAYGLATDANRTGGAFIVNFMYWAGIAQGAITFTAAQVITKARWPRPWKRLGEAMGLMMIPMYLFLIVFLLAGGLNVYEWYHWDHASAPPHKAIYLNPTFFVARLVIGLGLLLLVDILMLRTSLRPDCGVAAKKFGWSPSGPFAWLINIQNFGDEHAEVEAAQKKMGTLAPLLAVTYAIVFSMVAVDVSMSLAPHWYTNMFPAWYFMSAMWSSLVWLGMLSIYFMKWIGLDQVTSPKNYHDLGKLTFGLTMFWGYTTFAQYLPIWYGNMTEEIGFVLLRTELEPWATLSRVVVLMCFGIPWTMLLSRGLKKTKAGYLVVTTVLAVGIWLERFLVNMPSVYKGDTLPLGFAEIGMTLGFLGLFLTIITQFLSRVPPIPFTDPHMLPHPDDVHVVPSSVAHHH